MILLALLAAVTQQQQPITVDAPYRPASATIVVEPVAMMIAGFDADGDGRITRAEMQAGVARSFAGIDTEKAGRIGYIAFADWAERWLGDRNAVPSPFEVDRDGDNRITADELAARMDAIFTRFDKDKDGVLIHAELLTIRGSAYGERPEGRGGRGDRGEGRPPRR